MNGILVVTEHSAPRGHRVFKGSDACDACDAVDARLPG